MNNLNLSPTMHGFSIVILAAIAYSITLMVVKGIKRKIDNEQDYLKILNFKRMIDSSSAFPSGYKEHRAPELDAIEWIIGYYEHKTASEPKQLLESMLDATKYPHPNNEHTLRFATFLYYWVYYKRITNF